MRRLNALLFNLLNVELPDLAPDSPEHLARVDSHLQDFVICKTLPRAFMMMQALSGTLIIRVQHALALGWAGPDHPELACTELGRPHLERRLGNNSALVASYNSAEESPESKKDKLSNSAVRGEGALRRGAWQSRQLQNS